MSEQQLTNIKGIGFAGLANAATKYIKNIPTVTTDRSQYFFIQKAFKHSEILVFKGFFKYGA
ncbi:hypothetical protein J2TS6_24840 [Paenibacillus albilobatus]|uniref:Uncharacterized protein n=1 Tax=Paenibacillus albilobatus TaxID=2716884 RepID=A0A919XH97_9BACL|nr:hypothetical protein J2TS6_24840 [Paenibacillus albilobatus]